MASTGQNDLFGLAATSNESNVNSEEAYANSMPPWTDSERLAAEKSVLGLFLTGHPLDSYQNELKQITENNIGALAGLLERTKGKVALRLAGLVIECRSNYDRQGKTMASVILDDKTGRLDCAVYSEIYERYRDLLHEDNVLIVEGAVALNSYSGALRLTADKFYSIEQAREFFAKSLELQWKTIEQPAKGLAFIKPLYDVLLPFRGGRCIVTLRYSSSQARAVVQLGDTWRVFPSDSLIAQLKALLGETKVTVVYNK
jgi:DNA polymerase-3 subunit alpha